jgi:hypothetical protein
MLKRIIQIITIVSLCLLVFLLNVTTPATAGPFGILAILFFAYLSSLGVMTYFLYGMGRIITHLSAVFMVRRPIEALTLKRSYYYSTIIATAPILLIGLQSVGAGGVYEFLLVSIFVVMGCLYVSKRSH